MKSIINLNGNWKFSPTFDQKPTNSHNVVESKIPLYAHPSLNRCDWIDVDVPGVWQRYAERYSVFEGVCWFYREFELADLSDTAFINLMLKGVNYRADVYINGEYAGWHESAYTEFSMDISKLVKNGKNAVAIKVDNRPTEVKWPNDWGYGVYGGIHRDVFVEVYDSEYVYDIEVTPDFDVANKKGILDIKGKASDLTSLVDIKLNDKITSVKCENGQFCTKIEYDDIISWSVENPNLYDLTIAVGDCVCKQCKIGFRNVTCKDGKILINGIATKFNGACYVYDSPKYGLVMDREQLVEDLTKMKEANVNSIRTHYPMSDDFYTLCDEMGFMVWIEPNVYCSHPPLDSVNTIFKRQEFVDVAVSMTEEMIYGARQYASVVFYGIGNECTVSHPEARDFFKTLSDTVRGLDRTRLVGYASFYGLAENMADLVDVMGFNSYIGWYGSFDKFDIQDKPEIVDGMVKVREVDVSSINKIIDDMKKLIPADMPILSTEFGADSVPKYYSSACELWSEDYHAKVVSATLEELKKRSEVVGTFVFAFTDYYDPSKPKNGRWNEHNLKGMLTYERDYKLPFYALKDAYSK